MKTRFKTASLLSSLFLATASAAHASPGTAPDAVKVPDGNAVMMKTFAMGQITYECLEKKDAPGQFAWTFKIPHAYLYDTDNNPVGRYYGSPKGATWESNDGSRVIGKQLAVTPNAGTPGSIPLQLVQQNGYEGSGAMNKVTFIQRLATVGGIAPADRVCNAASAGRKELVSYQADYILWMGR
ncbi:DUF3455 domain-containing protein [Betaproteobacteria bacterium SCN1]|jgi:hypothetical protein|nr:DUF3455 domain-containing protein [Betaproteobacteria bacterium SCN1]MBN8759548.1 DUF3455 domain-containing protein [Thiobacillus sp.]ODU89733.1 MAG: hypothetical protein ABT21_08565 [Thiobacillus sp. SCN 65-179]OJW37661.1 MAG: hypothetical protein BGO61_04895 [Thiobacillus sp. 65-69]